MLYVKTLLTFKLVPPFPVCHISHVLVCMPPTPRPNNAIAMLLKWRVFLMSPARYFSSFSNMTSTFIRFAFYCTHTHNIKESQPTRQTFSYQFTLTRLPPTSSTRQRRSAPFNMTLWLFRDIDKVSSFLFCSCERVLFIAVPANETGKERRERERRKAEAESGDGVCMYKVDKEKLIKFRKLFKVFQLVYLYLCSQHGLARCHAK